MNSRYIVAVFLGMVVVAYIWKGKEIRAQLSMTGDGWDRLHPDVQDRAVKVIRDAQIAGLNVGIFEGWRSKERQLETMKTGNSWIGDPDNSYHRWGLAVDFVFIDGLGRWTWEPSGGMNDWRRLGEIIEKHGFEWGGRWRSFDGPHAQLPILTIAKLKAAYGDPESLSWA